MSCARSDIQLMSSTSSLMSQGSSSLNEVVPNGKFLLKTLCFAKKSVHMPSKDEYVQLLSCGLGARKWQVRLDMDATSFHHTLLNIYPRLSTVSSYTLWTIQKDKSLQRLPDKANTPGRIRTFLGAHLTGSLVIMPSEEISMGPVAVKHDNGEEEEEEAEENANNEQSEAIVPMRRPRSPIPTHHHGVHEVGQGGERHHGAQRLASHLGSSRSMCVVCGRMAKANLLSTGSSASSTASTTSAFHSLEHEMLGSEENSSSKSIASRLKDVLRVDLPKKRLVPSDEICKRCLRLLSDIDALEAQLRAKKDELVNTFYSTVAKIGRLDSKVLLLPQQEQVALPARHVGHHHHHHHHHSHHNEENKHAEGHHHGAAVVQHHSGFPGLHFHPTQLQSTSLPAPGLVPPHAEVGAPQRVYLAPSAPPKSFNGDSMSDTAVAAAALALLPLNMSQKGDHEWRRMPTAAPPSACPQNYVEAVYGEEERAKNDSKEGPSNDDNNNKNDDHNTANNGANNSEVNVSSASASSDSARGSNASPDSEPGANDVVTPKQSWKRRYHEVQGVLPEKEEGSKSSRLAGSESSSLSQTDSGLSTGSDGDSGAPRTSQKQRHHHYHHRNRIDDNKNSNSKAINENQEEQRVA